jgi:hypothetical protein
MGPTSTTTIVMLLNVSLFACLFSIFNLIESAITYTPEIPSLLFAVVQRGEQLWFYGKIVFGVIKGRFSQTRTKPTSFSECIPPKTQKTKRMFFFNNHLRYKYIYHFTGWSENEFPLQVPLAYDITMYGNCSAKIRVDRDPSSNTLAGRYKLYFCNSVEGLEYDLHNVVSASI